MSKLTYTERYWQRAQELVDKQVHHCQYCRRKHNEYKGDLYCFVRVIDIGAVPGEPANLVLACRRCRSNPRGPHPTRKQMLAKIAELPFPPSAPAKARNA
jgi:hypothetical protein